MAHPVGGVIDELLCGSDVESVAYFIVAADCSGRIRQAMTIRRITIGAGTGRGGMGGAVAGLVVGVGVDGTPGALRLPWLRRSATAKHIPPRRSPAARGFSQRSFSRSCSLVVMPSGK